MGKSVQQKIQESKARVRIALEEVKRMEERIYPKPSKLSQFLSAISPKGWRWWK